MANYVYGQKEPMENEAMVRTLDAQARAIWPLEKPLLSRLLGRPGLEVLDVGCGTGEISSRLVKEFSPACVIALDLSDINLRRARDRYGSDHRALFFVQASATEMPFERSRFDVAICRHLLQAVPEPVLIVKEMFRVVRPGGWLYFLAEDYGMMFFHPTKFDVDGFWRDYVWKAAENAGSNLRQGRTMPAVLHSLGVVEIEADYLPIDTLRVDRNILAEVLIYWRDGFEKWISTHAKRPLNEVRERFNDVIECTKSVNGYGLWLVPVIVGRVPEKD